MKVPRSLSNNHDDKLRISIIFFLWSSASLDCMTYLPQLSLPIIVVQISHVLLNLVSSSKLLMHGFLCIPLSIFPASGRKSKCQDGCYSSCLVQYPVCLLQPSLIFAHKLILKPYGSFLLNFVSSFAQISSYISRQIQKEAKESAKVSK